MSSIFFRVQFLICIWISFKILGNSACWVFNFTVQSCICSQMNSFYTIISAVVAISFVIYLIFEDDAIKFFFSAVCYPSTTAYCLRRTFSCWMRCCWLCSVVLLKRILASYSQFLCDCKTTPFSKVLASLAYKVFSYFWQASSSSCKCDIVDISISRAVLALAVFPEIASINNKFQIPYFSCILGPNSPKIILFLPLHVFFQQHLSFASFPTRSCLPANITLRGMTSILYLMHRLSLLAERITQKNTVTITDSRTGKTHELGANRGFIKSSELSKLTHKGKVLRGYDPGYMNTITCTSTISFIDGDRGILEYRGYPIEVLAEKCSFLEVAYLILWGELPTQKELTGFSKKVMDHTFVHEDLLSMMNSFRYDAHPMGMLCSAVAALSTLHPEQNPSLVGETVYKNKKVRNKQIYRLLGGVPTIAANAYRHRIGREYNKPHESAGYVENFLFMLDKLNEGDFKPHPKLVRALEILFILHAEHELNCSTAAVRHLSSSGVDIYTTIAGATGALYGGKHGGANEAVLRMLETIGKKSNIPQFIEDVKNKKGLLYGFGHRVYKNYDPRAKIVKRIADEVFEITGKEELIEIAVELERIALSDPYFIERKLYPNVDFYSGIIYRAMGFPTDMFPVLFMIPRVVGWLAHWNQFLDDPENKIVRPRQHYVGHGTRDYVAVQKRGETNFNIDSNQTSFYKRSIVSNAIK